MQPLEAGKGRPRPNKSAWNTRDSTFCLELDINEQYWNGNQINPAKEEQIKSLMNSRKWGWPSWGANGAYGALPREEAYMHAENACLPCPPWKLTFDGVRPSKKNGTQAQPRPAWPYLMLARLSQRKETVSKQPVSSGSSVGRSSTVSQYALLYGRDTELKVKGFQSIKVFKLKDKLLCYTTKGARAIPFIWIPGMLKWLNCAS
jgi:hypothetical protein